MARKIILRKDAKAQGLSRYFTGKPCKIGHIAERYITGECIVCKLAINEKWRLANLDKKRESVSRYIERDREHWREYQKSYHAKWYKKNRRKKLAQNKKYIQNHPEVAQVASLVHNHNKRARRFGVAGTFSRADLDALWQAQKNRCVYCQKELTIKTRWIDHIKPMIRGGSNTKNNLQWLCQSCSRRKGDKSHKWMVRKIKTMKIASR